MNTLFVLPLAMIGMWEVVIIALVVPQLTKCVKMVIII